MFLKVFYGDDIKVYRDIEIPFFVLVQRTV